jgi:hypothetical protein
MANVESHEIPGHEEHHEHGHHGHHDEFIHIDHKKHEIKKERLTGKEIRQIADPPIGDNYDLYLETPGPGDDEKIRDAHEVHLRHLMSFYSVLRQINPGACHAAP